MTRPQRNRASRLPTTDTGAMRQRAHAAVAALLVSAAFVVPACSRVTDGTAVAGADILSTSPSTPSIVRTAPTSVPTVTSVDEAVSKVTTYWNDVGVTVTVPTEAASSPLTCNMKRFSEVNALYCPDGRTMLYDIAWADTLFSQPPVGARAVEIVVAHEVGHAIAEQHTWLGKLEKAPSIDGIAAVEASADCYAGMYTITTGLSQPEIVAAVKKTAIGKSAVRIEAFRSGMETTDPNVCVKRYLP